MLRLTRAKGIIALCLLPAVVSAEQVVFSEIHYHPKPGKPEFVEIQNLTATVFDIAEWRFADGVEYTFPKFNAPSTGRTFLGKFERILVTGVEEAVLRAAYPAIPAAVKIYGPWTGALNNAGETLRLDDKNGVKMAEVNYGNDGRKWPISADGAGHSLRLARPNHGAGNWRNWAPSHAPDGTPGAAEGNPAPGSLAGLIDLSEIHFSAAGSIDWVELRSTTATAVNVDGLKLASALDFSDGVALTGSVPGGGYASWDVSFPVGANGQVQVFLVTADGTVLAAQKFDRRGDVTVETFQSAAPGYEWFAGPGHTRNAPNSPARRTDIVINEIMFDAPSDGRSSEFIELYNRGTAPVDLGGWSFVDGVSFDFPPGTSLAPGAFLVVAANPAFMAASYGGLQTLGPFSGQLSDAGELLRLEDNRRNLADQVDYLPAGDWPELADGDGSSMELKHPDMDNSFPTAWADSDEADKAPFQSFTYTAPFQQVSWSALSSGQELHTFLVGDAHVVLKNVSLRLNGAGANLVMNPATMSPTYSSASGWVFQGTHWASFIQGSDIHILADGHGDNKANRCEVDLANLSFNQSYTLTFDARWVNGKPRLIVQTLDHGFGTSFALPVPNNLGTPGAANSRLLASPAPAVSEVLHSPAVPTPVQPVKITARVAPAGGAPTVDVVHRLDSAAGTGAWTRSPMADDGATGGDTVAGDGVYTATLTQYTTQGQIAQFYVEAGAGGVSTMIPQFGPARPAMFIKDSRVMPSVLMRERLVISLRDRNALTTAGNTATFGYDFPRMSNHFFNATLIVSESEVRYNAGVRKSGSPFTRDSGSGLSHGKWQLPGDRLFRNRSKGVFDPSGASVTPRYYDDRIARYFLYLMGHPVNEMEYMHFAVNGDGFALREDHEPIATDFLDRVWDNGSEGTLLRIDDEWYFPNDTGDDGRSSRNADWSYKNSDNPIRYHSEWLMRSREADYDYSTFVEFVRAVGRNQFNEASINRMADRDMLCLNAAVRGYDADWDTITLDRGKNAYFYRPPDNGRWMLLHWDGDRVFEDPNRSILGGLPGIPTYFNQPYIRRTMNYYLTELLNRHTKGSARTEAWMQAEKTAVAGSGVVMSDAYYRTWFTNRETPARNFIGAPFNAAFAITTNLPSTANDTISISGTSPSSVYQVRIAGQPWVTAQWTTTTNWTLSGVALRSGANSITVEGVSHEGVVFHSQTFVTNKTGNAPPVMSLEASPPSFNVSLSEALVLDATTSTDPDGTPLTFAWTAPPANAALQANGGVATVTFQRPGLYSVSVTGGDGAGGSTVLTREAAVYGARGFSNFGTEALENFWELRNVEVADNFAGGPWYSLQTHTGRLHLHLPPNSSYPLGTPQNPLPPATTYVDFGSTWAFNDANIELGTEFAQPAFDDSLWQTGPGLLGVDANPSIVAPGIQTPMRRDSVGGLVTYYLRTEFQFDRSAAGSRVVIDAYADDGARFFLNGHDLGSVRMPPGPIDKNTSGLALSPEASATDNAVDEGVVNTDGTTLLVNGTNVLGVDLHNAGAGSSDMVFGAKLQIASYPTGAGGGIDSVTHPWVKRDLPASGDWVLQTDVELGGIQSGNFMAGLLVEVVRDGARFRYALGYRAGNELAVVQVTPAGLTGTLATQAYTLTDSAVLRIRREGDALVFAWRPGADFQELHRLQLPAGSTAVEGGPFATSESPVTFDALFDYTMLIDPSATSSAAGELVVSEIMYKPVGGEPYEFLELFNAGAAPVNLAGYRFPQGQPFDEFVFPDITIAPGGYLLLVSDLAAFRSRYGTSLDPIVAGEWAGGNLSNSGEVITLLDAAGLVVLSFEYGDVAPWPTAPDTNGASLILTNPAAGNTGNGADYSASSAPGGSPGRAESVGPFASWMADRGESDPLAIRPGESVNNLLTYAFGADLAGGSVSAVQPSLVRPVAGGQAITTFVYRRRMSGDPGLAYLPEWSPDGETWLSAAASVTEISATPLGDGTERVSLRLDAPLNSETRILLRLRVTTPY
jgi:Lamin Tail Domain/CotH kinase protein